MNCNNCGSDATSLAVRATEKTLIAPGTVQILECDDCGTRWSE